MTGPWAGYGREDGPEDAATSEQGRNPYLQAEPTQPEPVDRHLVDAMEPTASDAPWQHPQRRNPYLTGSDGTRPTGQHPATTSNSYRRNPYLQNPYLPAAYAQQRNQPDTEAQNNTHGRWLDPTASDPPALPAAPEAVRDWSLIVASIVMVVIVAAAVLILLNRSGSTTAAPPTAGTATVPRSNGASPAMPGNSPRAVTSPSGTDSPSGTEDANDSPSTTSIAPPTSSTGITLVAARAAATAWVDAINRNQPAPARALSCAAVRANIDAAFVQSVAGSIIITSVTLDEPAGARPTGTLAFTYQKTTDAQRKQDHLRLIQESGRWEVCR